jgi:SPW repeat
MLRVPTRVHGMLDYAIGALLIALPFLAGFGSGPQTWVPVALGAGVIAYSLLTDYELGVARRIQVPVHLWLDAVGGAFLAASPWLFGFDTEVWLPHVVVGVVEIATALVTDTIPAYERRRAG